MHGFWRAALYAAALGILAHPVAYFNMDDDACVFHMMGQPQETRHIVMHNEQAVICLLYTSMMKSILLKKR